MDVSLFESKRVPSSDSKNGQERRNINYADESEKSRKTGVRALNQLVIAAEAGHLGTWGPSRVCSITSALRDFESIGRLDHRARALVLATFEYAVRSSFRKYFMVA